jgi:hypothetical protein
MQGVIATGPTRVENAALAAAMLAGVCNVFKGLKASLEPGAEFYWRFTYAHGFIKRGLIGTLVHPLIALLSFERSKPVIVGAHVAVCLLIIVMLQVLFRTAMTRQSRTDIRLTLILAFFCLMCSPLMPVLAHDTGHVDAYLIALAIGGFSLILREKYGAAMLITIVGPLIHEAFIFLWAPVAIMLLWSSVTAKTRRAGKLILVILPIVCVAAVTFFHNRDALLLAMDAWPVDDFIKSGHLRYTFDATLQSRVEHMRLYEYQGHGANIAISLLYSLVPSVLLLWTALFSFHRQWNDRWTTTVVATIATLAPVSIILVAWDLSRFLSWTVLASAIVLIGVSSPTLVTIRPGHA